ncbi:uncharacterized protein EI97DRAFT_415140 [Westerdykella ornata]|uniref:Ribosomal protein bL31m N-terminal domain-containing protein n=1 Tax=Westerdykella ornata TaxID=318751 RepID=A0A6A6JPD9_WESOR|nr:uncharacterized protein EI97DRAFT_415140 [Westerdykella ornata]KAF2278520.1 hypothetical protein EI97DRAFT_415140 [Westerdykella ornata]
MAGVIPSPGVLRLLRHALNPRNPRFTHQVRNATLLRRPKRPYTFTQLVTLSDGSSFVHRTTNPMPIYKSTKDTRNTPLWNPSSQKLLNVEEDEAGKLKAFRTKFGHGWDAESPDQSGKDKSGGQMDNLLDLISGGDRNQAKKAAAASSAAPAAPPAKGKTTKK